MFFMMNYCSLEFLDLRAQKYYLNLLKHHKTTAKNQFVNKKYIFKKK